MYRNLQVKFIRDFGARFDLPEPKYKIIGSVAYNKPNTCLNFKNYHEEPQGILQSPESVFMVYDERNLRVQTSLNNPITRIMGILPIDSVEMDTISVNELIPEGTFDDKEYLMCHVFDPDRTCRILDCGDKAAEWIFRVFRNKNLRLGYFKDYIKTETWENFDAIYRKFGLPTYKLVEGNSVKIASMASVKHVYDDMYEDVVMNYLKPDIFIIPDKEVKPFEEHEWKWIKIGDAIFVNRKPSSTDFKWEVENLEDMIWKWKFENLLSEWEICSPGHIKVGQDVQVHVPSSQSDSLPILTPFKGHYSVDLREHQETENS